MKNKKKKESFLKREFLTIKSKIKNGPSHVYALLCWQKMGEAQQAMTGRQAEAEVYSSIFIFSVDL